MNALELFVVAGVVLAAGSVRGPVDAAALVVPRTAALPTIDGELGDEPWVSSSARTGAFVTAGGEPARPYSDARVAWREGQLLLGLYAADEDIRTRGPARDAFHVTLGTTRFEVSASGELRGAPPGTRVGVDHDGTLDDPTDDDEEWVLEIALPLAALGLEGRPGERIDLLVERCETPRGAARSCASSRRVPLALGR